VQPEDRAEERTARRLTSVLATDICGYSALSETNEGAAVQAVQMVRESLNATAEKYGGRVFHEAGDGFIAEFQSANDSLSAAFEFLESVGKLEQNGERGSIQVRVGLHVGDVVDQSNGDVLGHGVNIAARLQQLANPNSILASVNLVNLVSSRTTANFQKRGALNLKNIQQPMIAFDVEQATDRRSWLMWLRTIAQRQSIMAAAAAGLVVLAGAGVALSNAISNQKIPQQENTAETPKRIDRRAIRSATEVLKDSNMPVDAAVSALLETGSFDEAIVYLVSEHRDNRSNLSANQSTSLLHQAGALAFDRDLQTAQRLYRQILALHPNDWVAAAQLARVHFDRSEKGEAARLIEIALNEPNLTEQQRLRLQIDEARILSPPYSAASEELAVISRAAADRGYTEVETLAAQYSLTYKHLSIFTERSTTKEELDQLIESLERIMSRQRRFGFDRQLAQSYIQMGTLYLEGHNYTKALESYEQALDIENVLQRSIQKLRTLSNIARTQLKLGNHVAAQTFNETAIAFADEHDLVSTTHFNSALSAEIAFAQENDQIACARLLDARIAWPADQVWPEDLVELAGQAKCQPGNGN